MSSHFRVRRVDIVVYPGFKSLEAIGPLCVFDYANVHLRKRDLPPAYQVEIAAPQPGAVQSDTLMSLHAGKGLDSGDLPDAAILVGARNIEEAMRHSPAIVDWAAAVAPRIARLAALCSGSFFLAEAGLLDGRRATTHWSVSRLLQQRYPRIDVQADAIYIRQGNLWTSAGVTAGIDLALAMVEEDCGRDLALEVARDMVVYLKRPGGQSQFSMHLNSQTTSHPGIRKTQDWILSNLHQPLAVSDLAAHAAMSLRNFTRVFVRETGSTPQAFVETARVDLVRRLLEDAALPLKTVAARAGFGSDAQLRKVFQRHLGVTPRAYRERFASAGGSGGEG
ncbi:GlxA family transcriptional regulator [Pigmentiphaga kullae]|uniref:AraC family transcriptional regulator with amidase-like domain n=1 Tax=Pigmentiphaga kullae TaxID=151784 RepID=A0A4Q7N9Y6_9BURK|nr:GlxA family transcriptional regulator [Pigmentiphaga kullae]RZS78966.1 AraC family transcriptional regulator with amidase-like domain [Pigmentiphaga kullae]